MADAPGTADAGTAGTTQRRGAKGRFSALPPRVAPEDMVEETDASTPPDDPTSDPNREVANKWGAGLIVGF